VSRILIRIVLCVLGLPCAAFSQNHWTWTVHSARVDSINTDCFYLEIGVRADSEADGAKLGNHNLRGMMSSDLTDFNEGNDPVLLTNHLSGYEMSLSDGPDDRCWQLNAVFDGEEGNGERVDTTNGLSGIVFHPINQTFADDNVSCVSVSFDTTGGNVSLFSGTSDIAEPYDGPIEFGLLQNYPNPFNPETRIVYRLSVSCDVRVRVYTLKGEDVRTLVEGRQGPGEYTTIWNGMDEAGIRVSSGVYLLRLEAGSFSEIRKMTVLR
jgi:hypothetical protein